MDHVSTVEGLDHLIRKKLRGTGWAHATVSEVESRETGLTMLLLNLRGYV